MPFSDGQYLNSTDSVLCLKTNGPFNILKLQLLLTEKWYF